MPWGSVSQGTQGRHRGRRRAGSNSPSQYWLRAQRIKAIDDVGCGTARQRMSNNVAAEIEHAVRHCLARWQHAHKLRSSGAMFVVWPLRHNVYHGHVPLLGSSLKDRASLWTSTCRRMWLPPVRVTPLCHRRLRSDEDCLQRMSTLRHR